MTQRIALIVNSVQKLKASSNEAIHLLKGLEDYSCIEFPTEKGKHAIELAQSASDEGFDYVVAVGGDGTCNEVVNGIQLSKRKTMVKFGIIPNGTGNDFHKNIGSFDPKKFVECIQKNQSKLIDTIRLEHKSRTAYALNIAGIGFDGHVVKTLQNMRHFYGLKGKLAYAVSILRSFLSFKKKWSK